MHGHSWYMDMFPMHLRTQHQLFEPCASGIRPHVPDDMVLSSSETTMCEYELIW